MPTPFQEAAALASCAVDDVYAEDYLYQPMTAGADVNARPCPDTDRPVLQIKAVPLDSFARAGSGPARTQGVTAEKPGHASTRPQVSIDRNAFPYAVARGDRLTRMSDGAQFLVAEPRYPDLSRLTLDLNRIATCP